MKSWFVGLVCGLAIQLISASGWAAPVNAVVGDASWLERYGEEPRDASEVDRIRVHLLWIAGRLGSADHRELNASQRRNRELLLAELLDYAAIGVFPRRQEGDGYGARRPRFIDDRGVHCAVGELIARSGREELAEAINREFEFAFVPQIDSQPLKLWAFEHGFTPEELAMIQPGYSSPPTAESARADVLAARDSLTLFCGKKHPLVPVVRVALDGDRSGNVVASLVGKSTPFGACMVEHLPDSGGGAWDVEPRPFHASVKLEIPSPQALVERRMQTADRMHGCTPRPGPAPTSATVSLTADETGMAITVTTNPYNPEVVQCIAEQYRQGFRDVGPGQWKITSTVTKTIEPVVSSSRLEAVVPQYAGGAATRCYERGAAASISVEVHMHQASQGIDVDVQGGTGEFQACVAEDLRERLVSDFSVSRKLADGKYERFFLIDANASSRHEIAVETPEALERRLEEHRRRIDEERHRF